MAYYMGGEGRRLFGQTTPSELRDKFNMSVRQPIGVVGVITPWNFPIAIPSWKIRPRSSAATPSSSSPPRTRRPSVSASSSCSSKRACRPASSTSCTGAGERSGNAIVTHPDVPVITLTGSRETGVQVTKDAADRFKHVHLELGGKNAIIVLEDADLDLAVEGIIWSGFGTSGQRCTAASRVIAHEAVYDELASRLVAGAEKLRLGVGWEEDTDVGPVINQSALDKIHSYTTIGKRRGRDAADRRRGRLGQRPRQGLLLPADDLRRRRPRDADRPGGDLRADHLGDQSARRGRGDPGLERDQVRALVLDLHARREQARSARCAT